MVGLELMMTLVPGGARGAALKSNCPLIKGFADNFILELASLIIFYVKNSWSRRQYHSEMGYLDATKTIHKKKPLDGSLFRIGFGCMWWNQLGIFLYFVMEFCKKIDVSLSNIRVFGVTPAEQNCLLSYFMLLL